jgi:ElaB/YqjD/DUF883 family membrane-anchored ribosome-binding protein
VELRGTLPASRALEAASVAMSYMHRTEIRKASAAAEQRLADLIRNTEARIRDLEGERGAAVEKLRARAAATLGDARRRLHTTSPAGVTQHAGAVLRGTGRFVRRNPWRAVALGALTIVAVGVLLGARERG